MTCNPHPIVMTAAARQRGEELRAAADRYRLAKSAQGDRDDVDRRRPWIDLLAVAAVALTLLAAGNAVSQDGSSQTQHELEQATLELVSKESATIGDQR